MGGQVKRVIMSDLNRVSRFQKDIYGLDRRANILYILWRKLHTSSGIFLSKLCTERQVASLGIGVES